MVARCTEGARKPQRGNALHHPRTSTCTSIILPCQLAVRSTIQVLFRFLYYSGLNVL